MGCMEFWVINCFLASASFFILFLVVDAKNPYYPYAYASKTVDKVTTIDHKASATACIVASSLYLLIAIGLLFWKMNRDQRIKESQQYPRFVAAQGFEQQQYSQRGRSIEL